jgi:hypothetical protein
MPMWHRSWRGPVVDGSEAIKPGSGWLRPLVAVAALMVVLAVASTAAVVLVGGPKEVTYPAGSPEAAFQAFVWAAKRGDWTTADGLLSSGAKAQGVTAEAAAGYTTLTDVTVSIRSSSRTGDRATLSVDYEFSSGSGFGSNSYDTLSSVQMVLEADGWKLDSRLGGL